MFCTNCGTKFEGNFCPNCGNPAQTGESPSAQNTDFEDEPITYDGSSPLYDIADQEIDLKKIYSAYKNENDIKRYFSSWTPYDNEEIDVIWEYMQSNITPDEIGALKRVGMQAMIELKPREVKTAQKKEAEQQKAKSKGLECPACHSDNVTVEVVQTASHTAKHGTGLGGKINNTARALTAVSTLGMSNLVWKKSKGTEKTKFKNQKICICQNCGNSWPIK